MKFVFNDCQTNQNLAKNRGKLVAGKWKNGDTRIFKWDTRFETHPRRSLSLHFFFFFAHGVQLYQAS